MYVIIAGLLILLCVSNFQILTTYREGFKPHEVPTRIQNYVRKNILYDVKETAQFLASGVLGLLIILTIPLTYILSVLYVRLYMLYKAMSGK